LDNEVDIIGQVAGANQGFGFRLLLELYRKDKNIFFSPFSIGMALSMAYNGAKEGTKEAMARVLGVQDIELEVLNRSNASLMATLGQLEEKVQFVTANGMWFQKGRAFENDFLDINKKWYNATIEDIDLQEARTSDIINQWVRENTKGKIPFLVESLDQRTVLFIANAVYFKGIWTNVFEISRTNEEEFTLEDGSKKKLPMMVQEEEFNYYKGSNFQAIRLPYGYKQTSMYIFLPDENVGLDTFLEKMDSDTWKEWMGHFRKREGTIGLPRFRVEFFEDLCRILMNLKMDVAFDDQVANFKGISAESPNIYIGGIAHRTFLEVTEQGTEAAAASGICLKEAEAMPSEEEPFRMIVDRPFFCAIVHKDTGAILFMGSIVDPQRVEHEEIS